MNPEQKRAYHLALLVILVRDGFGVTVSTVNLLPLSLLIAPISIVVLMIALKKQKIWLTRLALLGMGSAVLLLFAFQYRDFKLFECYLLQGIDYKAFKELCFSFK